MVKFHQVKVKKGKKYSDWEYPIMKKYQMQCCDCGLVHEMNFKILKLQKVVPDGKPFRSEDIEDPLYRFALQARRNVKLTKEARKK